MAYSENIGDIPEWARWIAQDRNGTWWAYEHEPNQGDVAWYENEVGRSKRVATGDANRDWACTLKEIKH